MILYELFVGQPPFYTNNIYTLINLIVKNEVQYPSECSSTFKDFLKGLLTKDSAKRLQWPELKTHPFVSETDSSHKLVNWMNPKYRLYCFAEEGVCSKQLPLDHHLRRSDPSTPHLPPASPGGLRRRTTADMKDDSPLNSMSDEILTVDIVTSEYKSKSSKLAEWKRIESDAEDPGKALELRQDMDILDRIIGELTSLTDLADDGLDPEYQSSCLLHALHTLVLLSCVGREDTNTSADILTDKRLVEGLLNFIAKFNYKFLSPLLCSQTISALRCVLRESLRLGMISPDTFYQSLNFSLDENVWTLSLENCLKLVSLLAIYAASVKPDYWFQSLCILNQCGAPTRLVKILEDSILNSDDKIARLALRAISVLIFPAVMEISVLRQLPYMNSLVESDENNDSSEFISSVSYDAANSVVVAGDLLKENFVSSIVQSNEVIGFLVGMIGWLGSATVSPTDFTNSVYVSSARDVLRILLQACIFSADVANLLSTDKFEIVFEMSNRSDESNLFALAILREICDHDPLACFEASLIGLEGPVNSVFAYGDILVSVLSKVAVGEEPNMMSVLKPKQLNILLKLLCEARTWGGISVLIQHCISAASPKAFGVEPYGYLYQHTSPQDLPGVLLLAVLQLARVTSTCIIAISRNIFHNVWESVLRSVFIHHSMNRLSPVGTAAWLQVMWELLYSNREESVEVVFQHEAVLHWIVDILHTTHIKSVTDWPLACGGSSAGALKMINNVFGIFDLLLKNDLPQPMQKKIQLAIYSRKLIQRSLNALHRLSQLSNPFCIYNFEVVIKVLSALVVQSEHFARQLTESAGLDLLKQLQCLSIVDNEQIASSSLDILIKSAGLASDVPDMIINLDFLEEFGVLLNCPIASMRAKTCRLLGKLCKHSREFYNALVKPLPESVGESCIQGRNDLLMHLISRCKDPDSETRKLVCFAIGNAAYHSDILYEDLKYAIPALAHLLGDKEKKTRANAAGALGNFVRNSGVLCGELIAQDVHKKLISLVEVDPVLEPRRMALFSLGNMIIYKQCREAILKYHPLHRWIKDLSSRVSDEKMRTHLSRLMIKLDMPPLR